MAMADYYLCNVCGEKAFYDADLAYDFSKASSNLMLYHVGQMLVVCSRCFVTHRIALLNRETSEELAVSEGTIIAPATTTEVSP